MIDIFLSWRTAYYDHEGILVVDKKLVRKRYIKTWFFIDLFASIPYDYFGQLVTIGTNVEVPNALQLPSMAKLLRILRLGKKIDRLSSSKIFR